MTSDDLSDMQKAFEHFMTQRGGGKKNEDSVQLTKAEKEAREFRRKEIALQQDMKRAEKEYINLFKRFVSRMKGDWMEIDDQTYQVVQAISNIRSRLPMETQLLRNLQQAPNEQWSLYGNMNSLGGHFFLNLEDVKLGRFYDLAQHEKMMEALRRLLSNLSDCHEALLRMLDEMMKHHLECMNTLEGTSISLTSSFQKAASLSNVMNDAMGMMSLELYRKQKIAQIILDSSSDDLLVVSTDERFGAEERNNWVDLWNRDGKYSCIQKETFLDIMKWV